jgi:HK97 family phage portal protein
MGLLDLFKKARAAINKPFYRAPKQKLIPKDSITWGSLVETALSGVYDHKRDGHRVRTDWSFKKACQEGFESSTWVYACVTTWMSQVASIPWIVRKRSTVDGEWTHVKGHDIENFLRSPNPFMSGGDLMERLTADLQIGGNHLWKKIYSSRGKLLEVWPMDQDSIKPVPDRDKFIANYAITNNSNDIPLSTKEVVHFMLPNPRDIFWGQSPLRCIEKVLDCDLEALQWWVNAVYSGCRKDGVLSFKHDLTQDQYDFVIKKVREQLVSNISGRFPIVMGHEATYTPYDMSPAELDFTNSRKMTREEIAAAFKVPPPLIGILDHSTYNNLTTARRIFWVDAVLPFLERIKSTLNRCLKPDFISKQDLDDYIIDYDISRVEALSSDFTEKLNQAVLMLGMGFPLNVINRRLELDCPDVEGGDVGYILQNYVPIDQVGAMAAGALSPPKGEPQVVDATDPKAQAAKPLPKPKPDIGKKEQEMFTALFDKLERELVESI